MVRSQPASSAAAAAGAAPGFVVSCWSARWLCFRNWHQSSGDRYAVTPSSHRGLGLVQMEVADSDRESKAGRRWEEKLHVLGRLILRTGTISFLPLSISPSQLQHEPQFEDEQTDSTVLIGGTTKHYGHFWNLLHGSNVCDLIIVMYNVTVNWILIFNITITVLAL